MNILKKIKRRLKRKYYRYRLKRFARNKETLSAEILKFKGLGIKALGVEGLGIESKKQSPRLIVSLTSFPERMNDIHFCIYSLLRQSLKPDMLILWLGVEQYPNREKDIPQSLLKLCENGLTIKWTKDTKSYKKLVPALKEFPNDIIVTADDDLYYNSSWLEILYKSYTKKPKAISAHRIRSVALNLEGNVEAYSKWDLAEQKKEASFLNFQTGAGGVLYPPNCLCKEVFNEENFTKLAPFADDVWFWAMALKNNTKIINTKANFDLIYVDCDAQANKNGAFTLFSINKEANGNDRQIKNVLDFYNLHEKLKS